MGARKWSNDRIEQLRADLAKGLSVATIAQRLSTTRSAVSGKIRRLELNCIRRRQCDAARTVRINAAPTASSPQA
jgi:hypothetical protein